MHFIGLGVLDQKDGVTRFIAYTANPPHAWNINCSYRPGITDHSANGVN